MKFGNPYWGPITKMALLQRWILIHSILYYEYDESIVTDKMYDENSHQLVDMQKEFLEEAKQTPYWYVFYDFDGSTGFDLAGRLEGEHRAYLDYLINQMRRLHDGEMVKGL
jgi:hypothetical protein